MNPQLSLSKATRALVIGSAALVTLLASSAGASGVFTPVKLTVKPAGKTQITAVASGTKSPAAAAGMAGLKMTMPFFLKPGGGGMMRPSTSALPHAAGTPAIPTIVPTGPDFGGFNGMTNLDQASAGTGFYANTNFDLEPPDQGLAVGNYRVVEAVNDAIAVYNTQGKLLAGPTPMNQFFKLAPYAQPNFTPPFGPFLSDIRCYYDYPTKRFFVEEWGEVTDPGTGAPVSSFIGLAVSDTADPTGTFTLYYLNSTNYSPSGVASIPDYTYVGADANGIYLSSNYFALDGSGFQGVTLIALSKSSLETGFGASGYLFGISPTSTPSDQEAFALAPSITPPKSAYATSDGGTEYFADTLDPTGTTDTRINLWALTNTSSLDTFIGTPTLTNALVTTEAYGFPVPATQKLGSIPLGDLYGLPEAALNPDDDRLFQLVYANGSLCTANTTIYYQGQGPTGKVHDAIAYYSFRPNISKTGVMKPTVSRQGYIYAQGEDLIYPTFTIQPVANNAVFSFTLTGPDYYPSAAYLNLSEGEGTIHLAKKGAAPEDGFSGYGGGVARWGDYSAAVTSEDGSAWLATEYIPNLPRDTYANWGTFISHIQP